MDDLAASQQLIDEVAAVDRTTNNNGDSILPNGTISSTSSSHKKRKRKSSGASKPKEPPTPQPAASQVGWSPARQSLPGQLRSYTLADPNDFADSDEEHEAASSGWPVSPLKSHAHNISTPSQDDNVEVPDSQTVPVATAALMSPPMTSSVAVPASMPEESSTHKKSHKRKRKRKKVNSGNSLPAEEDNNRGEETAMATGEVLESPTSPTKGKRRHSNIISPSPSSQAEANHKETAPTRKKLGNKRQKMNGIEACDLLNSTRKPNQRVDDHSILDHEEEAQDDADKGHAESKVPGQKRRKKSGGKAKADAPAAATSGIDLSESLGYSSGEDEIPPVSPSESQGSAQKRKHTKVRKSARPSQTPRRIRTSNINPTNVLTAAERSLNTARDLNYPPDLRTSGDFTQDEDELIRRAIRDYQERKGLDTLELVELIQWTDDTKDISLSRRISDLVTKEVQDKHESNEFWEEIKDVNLTRSKEIVRSHIRSQYHIYKSGGWTKEEDEQLKNLFELYPRQWKLISKVMGDRSMHDVHNRWRDYVQYGDKRNTSTWSKDEENLLVRSITTVAQRDEDYRAAAGKRPLNEYTNKDINWMEVCTLMGNVRSRLQCTVKWTKMQSRNPPPRIQLEIKPRNKIVSEDEEDQTRVKTPKKRGRPRKSDAQQTPQSKRKRGRPRKSEDISIADTSTKQEKKRRKSRKSDVAAPESTEEHGGELQEQIEPDADAELDEGFDEPAIAKSSTSKKQKQKMSARESTSRSRPPSKKKSILSESRTTTPKSFKSAELIIDSDDIESE
ncbi:hypothetical protein N0V83_002252 [Neocucurbitaria cava]|uniref:Uncharacterized protein n=1 Tax=Neocucurbitaria cava TaxID=798079 RepID=A0A9W8YEW8_9PLEO|nr:hypothetical protein N0V83_002252 [Neocucurbitaria cava]